ncbi:ATP synthase F0 subunit C [Desulfurobacterium indicum]|uniref:ATP synthase subunit c n=1 Tax=Desulfurobacterium indicum TaxID=1914305 RepID=A0A1R1MMF7_9BACT|nr:ATP synthase F0 subunit C [Desulfurobacterium indicum]OMH41008.1 F0F1 ATP synthase subunit C [Desulfurobacterium indicum]
MKIKKESLLYTLFLLLAGIVPAMAGEGGASAASIKAAAAIGAGLAIGGGAAGAGVGQGLGLKGTQEAIARNPGAAGRLTTNMFIGLALIEALAIYALVVALILLFVF